MADAFARPGTWKRRLTDQTFSGASFAGVFRLWLSIFLQRCAPLMVCGVVGQDARINAQATVAAFEGCGWVGRPLPMQPRQHLLYIVVRITNIKRWWSRMSKPVPCRSGNAYASRNRCTDVEPCRLMVDRHQPWRVAGERGHYSP